MPGPTAASVACRARPASPATASSPPAATARSGSARPATATSAPVARSSSRTTCADSTSDAQNCGNCGSSARRDRAARTASAAAASARASAGRRDAYCDLDAGSSRVCCPGGGCADVETDSSNCGYCGYACQPGLSCIGAQCVATSCTSAIVNQPCLRGDGGEGGCCGTTCLDMSDDPNNCGGCGVKCAAVEVCELDNCVIAQCSRATRARPARSTAGVTSTWAAAAELLCGPAERSRQLRPVRQLVRRRGVQPGQLPVALEGRSRVPRRGRGARGHRRTAEAARTGPRNQTSQLTSRHPAWF